MPGKKEPDMTRNATILLVEEHPIVEELITHLIATCKPNCRIVTVDNPEHALASLKRESVHLVITNLEFSQPHDGFAFLAVINGWNPPIPIIALSERPPEELPAMAGGIAVLHKPIDFEVLLELIDTMTLAAQESVLNGISLENFLQMLEQERKTCTLRILSGYQMGYLFLHQGRLIKAKTGLRRQKEAALAILAWPNCTINITEECAVAQEMNLSIQTLLVEWCINKDEGKGRKSSRETVEIP
jgi:CheY-like chemotaxis protein